MANKRKEATVSTEAISGQFRQALPFDDVQDFEDAKRGFIAPLPANGIIRNSEGRPVWDASPYADLVKQGSPAPSTVNPSLWRQSQLVVIGGLFKVTERLYQVRNADLSNLTIVEGNTGIIVIDPLISTETAKAALELYYQHRPKRPIVAVFYSHSHVDHYGGVKGIISEDDVKSGKVIIVAPEGFVSAAVAENILAGNVMARRASYMYGNLLPVDAKGQVGAGLGMTTSTGTITLIPPTHQITHTGQKMMIDGLDFQFMIAPDSEAPAEMHWYIEQLKAVTAAENCSHTMHNIYTPRGAKIRDPLAWSKYLDQTIALWGHKAEVMYGMHNWPTWGSDHLVDMLKKARDGYRFINDQTLRMANHGHTMAEIAEKLKFPPELQTHWAMRGYYGTLNHNVKATYVKYLGWFDGNPTNLHCLPHQEASKKYVELMGGVDKVLEKAQISFGIGEYRWVSEIVNRVVFADPSNVRARELQASALEQLGYQSESACWRNFYLSAAQELREGIKQLYTPATANWDMVKAMDVSYFFDFMGVRLNGEKAAGKKLAFNINFTDTKEQYVLNLENAALSHRANIQIDNPDATLMLTREAMNKIILRQSTYQEEMDSGAISIEGNAGALLELVSLMDTFKFWFNIVEPKSKL